IKIIVPTIINLETALIFCHTVAIAFALFNLIGNPITNEIEQEIIEYANLQTESFKMLYHEKEKRLLPYE
ncbi:MAG: hypothetical protein K2I70_05105, partial [Bacilli bacterium]|nr:hypothetical protein [Bacilli bacterium]